MKDSTNSVSCTSWDWVSMVCCYLCMMPVIVGQSDGRLLLPLCDACHCRTEWGRLLLPWAVWCLSLWDGVMGGCCYLCMMRVLVEWSEGGCCYLCMMPVIVGRSGGGCCYLCMMRVIVGRSEGDCCCLCMMPVIVGRSEGRLLLPLYDACHCGTEWWAAVVTSVWCLSLWDGVRATVVTSVWCVSLWDGVRGGCCYLCMMPVIVGRSEGDCCYLCVMPVIVGRSGGGCCYLCMMRVIVGRSGGRLLLPLYDACHCGTEWGRLLLPLYDACHCGTEWGRLLLPLYDACHCRTEWGRLLLPWAVWCLSLWDGVRAAVVTSVWCVSLWDGVRADVVTFVWCVSSWDGVMGGCCFCPFAPVVDAWNHPDPARGRSLCLGLAPQACISKHRQLQSEKINHLDLDMVTSTGGIKFILFKIFKILPDGTRCYGAVIHCEATWTDIGQMLDQWLVLNTCGYNFRKFID